MALKQIQVTPAAEGMHLGAFVLKYAPEIPETEVREAFRRRDVKLGDKRCPRETCVHAGESVRIYYMDSVAEDTLDVVYEDADVLLVQKKPGISVEPDEQGGTTLTELCARHIQKKQPDAAFLPAACHRLDNKTCGLCLFAKNPQALEILQQVFRARTMEKYYECLVRGVPKPPAAQCKAYLVKYAREALVQVYDHPVADGKPIITAYETLRAGTVSRLRVHLITGRTHQIRAHLSALGHPILGDDVYGDRGFNRENKTRVLKLCAVSLKLDTGGRLPQLDGRLFEIKAPF